MKNKNPMSSHEEYCRQLKIAVKRYTDFDIIANEAKTRTAARYADYNAIYKEELKLRNLE